MTQRNGATALLSRGLRPRTAEVPPNVIFADPLLQLLTTNAPAAIDPQSVPTRAPRRRAWAGAALAAADVVAFLLTAMILDPSAWAIVLCGAILIGRLAARVYRPRMRLSVLDDLPRSTGSVLAAYGLTLGGVLVAGGNVSTERTLLIVSALFLVLAMAAHECVFAAGRRLRRSGIGLKRTVIVGAGHVGTDIAKTLLEYPELGLSPVGFVDSDALTASENLPCPMLSIRLSDLRATLTSHEASILVIAYGAERESAIVDAVIAAHQSGCEVFVVPRMFELHHDSADVERIRGVPLHRLSPDPTLRLSWRVKVAIDVCVASLALVALAPLLAVVAAAILLDSGRPVLFWQERIGLDGRKFRLCKFRSMRPVRPGEPTAAWSAADDPRLSRIGKFLRRTSLDEVPQLWNIVRRDMSLVGPRPERPEYVVRFSSEHARYWARHRVPAGMTGLAQVNGLRGDTSIGERARYDNYYIANWSLWLDLRVVLLTAREVLRLGGE